MDTNLNYPADFLLAKDLLYAPYGLLIKSIILEKESKEYGALSFGLNNKSIKFRIGKITPTKAGCFVTLWKRECGITKPHDISDQVDFFIISVRDQENFGQFIFNKSILNEKDIFSGNGKKGKRGIRVYPPWVTNLNNQARKTQIWQCEYFVAMNTGESSKISKLTRLLK